MKIGQVVLLAVVAVQFVGAVPASQPPAQPAPDYNAFYQIGPDSLPHEGVPKGEVLGPFVLPSQVYPGTQHTYWVYVPAQYDAAVPASLMIFHSRDPDRHGIGGASSGAIAAFTVAWQRPNDFRKVLSIVGSFVNLRGGDAYADIVRRSDK